MKPVRVLYGFSHQHQHSFTVQELLACRSFRVTITPFIHSDSQLCILSAVDSQHSLVFLDRPSVVPPQKVTQLRLSAGRSNLIDIQPALQANVHSLGNPVAPEENFENRTRDTTTPLQLNKSATAKMKSTSGIFLALLGAASAYPLTARSGLCHGRCLGLQRQRPVRHLQRRQCLLDGGVWRHRMCLRRLYLHNCCFRVYGCARGSRHHGARCRPCACQSCPGSASCSRADNCCASLRTGCRAPAAAVPGSRPCGAIPFCAGSCAAGPYSCGSLARGSFSRGSFPFGRFLLSAPGSSPASLSI